MVEQCHPVTFWPRCAPETTLAGCVNAVRDGLTFARCQTSLFAMATLTTTREFIRNFARIKKAAANGEEVIVRDRQGQTFTFRANVAGPSRGEQLSDLRGSICSGKRVKTLEGFGRNRT